MVAWPKKRIDELCEITSSKRIYAADYVPEGVPFYRGREITEKYKGNLDVTTELFIKEEKFSEIKHKFGAPQQGDLLLTSVGTLGSVYVVKPGERFYFKDGNLTWFRNFKELDSQFLYYWMGSPQGKAELQKCTIGSSQSAFTIVLLKGLEIKLPPLLVQRRIADILSAYDKLIENSQRRIRILAAMARALYREWFVLFRFPGHDKFPRVAATLGEIPKGWEVKKLGEIADISWGDTSTTKASYLEEGYAAYSASGMDGKLDHFDYNRKGIVLSAIGAQCGRTWIARGKWSCIKNTIRFWSKDESASTEFLFIATEGQDFWPRRGAAQPFISQGDAERLGLLIPDSRTMQRFTAFASDALDQISMLEAQIQNLRRTRDLMLPRLMSGQIELTIERGD